MPRALWNGTVLAESEETVVVENNHYFPPDSIRREHFEPSRRTSHCAWKGKARYYDVVVGGERRTDAAWCYPKPRKAASHIRDHVAFARGISVES